MQKLSLILTCVIQFVSNQLSAQVTFQKTFFAGADNYDQANSVQQTADGGYIVAGQTRGYCLCHFDVYLIKTDANGDTLWTKIIGGSYEDEAYSVQQTADSGFVIAGWTESFAVGFRNVYLIKTDSDGNLLWSKTYGGSSDNDEAHSVQQTSDGGYVIAGITYSFGAGEDDIYLIKTDANGDTIWTKTYGGLYEDEAYSVQQTADGGYVIAGLTASFGVAGDNVYLIKTDANGDTIWTKTYGGAIGDIGRSVRQTSDGGYIITGHTSSFGSGGYDVYLIKTDANGDTIWTKTYGGSAQDEAYSVQQTADGGYVIAGRTVSFGAAGANIYLIKTDANGDTLWTKSIGGSNYAEGYSVQQTAEGGYVIAGLTWIFSAGFDDVLLIKTDSSGNSGCNEEATTTIVTSPATQVSSPATIVTSPATIVTAPATVIGIGGTVTTLCATGINSEIPNPKSVISISPNPSEGNFIIKFSSFINTGSLEFYNVLGEDIFSAKIINESKKEINLKNILPGIYFVKVFDGENYYCGKIMIEHD